MHQKRTIVMTKEEVAQIVAYCEENKISYKQRLVELGIGEGRLYNAKCKYEPREEKIRVSPFS